ncbi:MAG: Rrf2 family transcriptional regulator [Pirellulaceae bacterium]
MKLSRTVAYAVRATLQLANNESLAPVPCSRLAAEGKMPERFLLQILRNLVTHGILRSTRGVDGGYSLVRPPSEISLLEVIEAIEGPLNTGEPVDEELSVDFQNRLQEALQEVTNNSRRQLEAIKLSQLLAPPELPDDTESREAGPQESNYTDRG